MAEVIIRNGPSKEDLKELEGKSGKNPELPFCLLFATRGEVKDTLSLTSLAGPADNGGWEMSGMSLGVGCPNTFKGQYLPDAPEGSKGILTFEYD